MTRNRRSSLFFSIVIIAICLALSVTIADLFSSVLTVGFFSSDTRADSKFEVYAVSLLKTQSRIEATEHAKTVQTQSGAGYVWAHNGAFYVLASAYEQENDATLVHDNLKAQSVSSEIINLTFPALNFKEDYSSEEKAELSSAAAIYKTSFKKLYDISVSLDTSLISETDAKINAGSLLSDITKGKSNFETRFNEKKNSETVYLGVKYKDLLTAVQKLADAEKVSDLQTYSSLIKYTYVKLLSIYSELASELAIK